MTEQPRYLSTFSGIGGIDAGLDAAGWQCVGQVEIDDYCTRVLERHWPGLPRWRDIRTVTGDEIRRRCGPVDLICGGFPCVDVSVAGKRAGLAGARSGLFFEFARLVGELRPPWLLVENVVGLLSSAGGRDFAAVLHALGSLGYGLAWRLCDSRYWGVPQRRRRLFLVGRARGPVPFEVLFEPTGRRRHPAPRRQAGAVAAARIASRFRGGGGGPDDNSAGGNSLVTQSPCPLRSGWVGGCCAPWPPPETR